jgi:CheY-like chemotaxis protein
MAIVAISAPLPRTNPNQFEKYEKETLHLPRRNRRAVPTRQLTSNFLASPEEDSLLEDFSGPGEPQRQPVILVVEDESIQAIFLRRVLRRLGYQAPEHAASGPEAIEKAAQYSPDLILMDVRLRGPMDGITAAGHIQSERRVPIIYLTAYADQTTLRRIQQTRAYGFLQKPVDDEILVSAIEAALTRHRAELEGIEPEDDG